MPDNEATALNGEGFPDYMIMAFLQLAEGMRTAVANGTLDDKGIEDEDIIVSCRVPGGVGTDLMEAGYDLKGFQIKAKSCDWGPMAGFICQLPFLNKAGYEKIAYNTGYIVDYLKYIEGFASIKEKINTIEEAFQKVREKLKDVVIATPAELVAQLQIIEPAIEKITKDQVDNKIITAEEKDTILDSIKYAWDKDWQSVPEPLQPPEQMPEQIALAKLRKEVFRVYSLKQQALKTTYKATEHTKAAWSGENTIPEVKYPETVIGQGAEGAALQVDIAPFVHLKRRFPAAMRAALAKVRDMNRVTSVEPIPGTEVEMVIGGTAMNDTLDKATIQLDFILKKAPDKEDAPDGTALWAIYYEQVRYRSDEKATFTSRPVYTNVLTNDEITKLELRVKKRDKKVGESEAEYAAYTAAFDKKSIAFTKKLDQIYKKDALEKTTIAGRACYPVYGIMNPHPPYKTPDDAALYYKNAVSGDFDLFAFWPSNATSDLKLVRMSEQYLRTSLKLRPEVGTSFWLEFIPGFRELVDANEQNLKESAEEGNIHPLGRQVSGVLNSLANTLHTRFYGQEPGAVRKSDVNSAFHSDEGGRPGIMEVEFPIAFFLPRPLPAPAPLPNTKGGLIRNPTELLALMQASCKAGYQVIMHSAWMIHFFYISKPPVERERFQSLLSEKKKKEFVTLEINHAEMYPAGNPFVEQTFENSLKTLFGLPDEVFIAVREAFLAMVSSDADASARMELVRQLIIRR